MKIETTLSLFVENIKCSGCAASIEKALLKLYGVENVRVEIASGEVIVTGNADRQQLVQKLTELGYPEKGNNSLSCKARSYVSCAFGKFS